MARNYYDPTPEHLERLSGVVWCCSYSGGKDSTALVTWLEWLRRTGWITAPAPALVQSDTTVEYETLACVSGEMMHALRASGWVCAVVTPKPHEKLYNRILGIGNMPVHPGIRNMRWCTRSTKIDPMRRWKQANGGGLTLTGLRLGESSIRDEKIRKHLAKEDTAARYVTCAAGGECGIPPPGEGMYSPILNWKTCQVMDWLNGHVGKSVREVMGDLFAVTQKLVTLYAPTWEVTLDGERELQSASRFGCIGCPAIGAEREAPASVVRRHGAGSPLLELYDVWFDARQHVNRCWKFSKSSGKSAGYGPIRLEARRRLFDRVMDIQHRAGVTLISVDDETFIRNCWERKVYPRGWSEADELTTPASDMPLFGE